MLVRQRLENLRTLTLGVTPKVVRERDASTREERGDGDVRCRVLAHCVALRREECLEVLNSRVQLLDGALVLEELVVSGEELGRDAVDEEAGLGALDRVGREDLGLGEEVGDELDEDERLCELDGLGRGIVGRGLGAAVGDRGDLHTWEFAYVGLRG